MMPRNLLILALLLGLTGCGCNDDSTTLFGPEPTNPLLLVKSRVPPIPVDPPRDEPELCKIDVMFVLDDSDGMLETTLGVNPDNPGDLRKRSEAARLIMQRLRETIKQRLKDAYAETPSPTPPLPWSPAEIDNLDFAFGVARFEDFGGSFTSETRRIGDVDDPDNKGNDQDARPFILNLPLLRENLPDFGTRFTEALARTAPGDGNPAVNLGFVPQTIQDPQSAIEALYQLAAPQNPDGTYGGFDGDGGGTLGSGLPTSLNPQRNPQTLPGDTGDVPAIGFNDLGTDADGEPLFQVRAEDGTPVTIPGPTGAEVPSTSSGNIGGAGWREGSARFIILASDIATVAPMRTPPSGVATDDYPGALGVSPAPGDAQEISSTDGGADAPRGARTVKTRSFDGGVQLDLSGPLTSRRIGSPGGDVSPSNAHTIEDAIERLNALNIEVLLIGAPDIGALSTKPGALGVNGDSAAHIAAFNPSANVGTPGGPSTLFAPWLWMSAVSRLTTPEVTSVPQGGGTATYPGVYNIGTVWLPNTAEPRTTVTDDLAERIRQWIDDDPADQNSPYKTAEPGGVVPLEERPTLPTALYRFTLQVDAPSNPDVLQDDNLAPYVVGESVPIYWSDQTAPADVEVVYPADGTLSYTWLNDTVTLPATATVGFRTFMQFQALDGPAVDADTLAKINSAIIARKGLNGNPTVLPTEEIQTAQAAYTVTVRDTRDPLATSRAVDLIEAGAQGCAIIQEQTVPVADKSEQQAGICPFPQNP